jgi:hypothetical protein
MRIGVVFVFAALVGGVSAAEPERFKQEIKAGVEEIFVFRTTRARRTSGPTAACSSAPFPSVNEDFYDLWSVKLRASDARIDSTHESSVGGFTACFGQGVPGQPLPMYAIGNLAHIAWTAVGQCNLVKSQPSVHTVVAFNCELDLSGLPQGYSGGFLVSSTLAPALGKDADPTASVPGYLSSSVVTARLWRSPTP